MLEVIQPGLETSVQDYPGRIGYWNQGFPPSGPMDSWSFRLANILVGNEPGDAGFECQFNGPTLKFGVDSVIAVTGANMNPKLDNNPIPMWESVAVKQGQVLQLSFATTGARSYIAFAGGIKTTPWLDSRSTFHKAGVGGMEGNAIKKGQTIPLGTGQGKPGRKVKEDCKPVISTDKTWMIDVVAGPNDDWIDAEGHKRFLTSDWKLSAKSDRTGFRLDGPDWTFTDKAHNKSPEHGSEPSNIIDQGYPVGAINLAGQTPIILVNDGPSMGGFINPYTVPSSSFWKLGQSKPGEIYHFNVISVDAASEASIKIRQLCSESSII
ncbi:biotin-dependent carboxyltransferase family protein [bacterium]|nr:biotin-dependent carboxyltransferase family protein [bacterium]